MIYIGIDGGKHTGVAIWSGAGKSFMGLHTIDFWTTIDLLSLHSNSKDCTVVVEDVSANKPTFNRGQSNKVNDWISQSVGRVKRETELIIEFCERNNIKVIRARPTGRSMTKLTSDQFKLITKYKGRTSQHSRDAGMLVFGR